MKRVISVLLVALLGLTTRGSAAVTGDVSGDGNVNVSDVTTEINQILSGSTDGQFDVNGDGKVDVSDVTTLINAILSTSTYDEKMCDLNGDGNVDASDVTILITLISKS